MSGPRTGPGLIGLTGTNGAGKGEAAAFLRSLGYAYHSLSDILREELLARGLEASRDNLIAVGNELRETFGPDILAGGRWTGSGGGPSSTASGTPARSNSSGAVPVPSPGPGRADRRPVRPGEGRGRDESAATLEEFRRKEEIEMNGRETASSSPAAWPWPTASS